MLQWFNLTGRSKLKAVLDYLKDLLEGEDKFLCFAHHQVWCRKFEKNRIPEFEIAPFPPQVVMDSVAGLLEERKARYIRIDGGTSSSARHEMCRQFQVLNIPIF